MNQSPEAHGAAPGEPGARVVPRDEVIEDEVVHPHDAVHGAGRSAAQVAGRRAPHRRVSEQAQRDAVERAAGRGLAEVSDRPAGEAPVEEEAAQRLVAGLAAGAGVAPDVQTPAEHEDGLRAVRARSGLIRPVGADHGGRLPLWVALVDVPDTSDTPAPDQIARTAGEERDVIAVADVEAIEDRAPRQRGGQVARGEQAGAPRRDSLVPDSTVRDVAEEVVALLGHGAFGLDDSRQGVAGQDGLGGALEEISGHLLAELRLYSVHLPALVVGEVRGGDTPAGARVAELPHHDGPRDAVHLDVGGPHMSPSKEGGHVISRQDRDAELVLREADVFGEEA